MFPGLSRNGLQVWLFFLTTPVTFIFSFLSLARYIDDLWLMDFNISKNSAYSSVETFYKSTPPVNVRGEKHFYTRKKKLQLTFNPGLTLTFFRTTRPWKTYNHENCDKKQTQWMSFLPRLGIILGNPGATRQDDAIFSGERYFRAKSLLQELKSPGSWSKLLLENIASSRPVAPGFPRMAWYLQRLTIGEIAVSNTFFRYY